MFINKIVTVTKKIEVKEIIMENSANKRKNTKQMFMIIAICDTF